MKCKYFAMCDHDAIGTLPNPVLGPVPVCKRCANQVGAVDKIEDFTPELIIAAAAEHEIDLELKDFKIIDGYLTIDGEPADQWLDAMTMD